jgi:hypothetical protein
MPKLTIEIDMDDSWDTWRSLFRRIEEHAEAVAQGEAEPPKEPTQAEVTRNRRIFWATEMGGISD